MSASGRPPGAWLRFCGGVSALHRGDRQWYAALRLQSGGHLQPGMQSGRRRHAAPLVQSGQRRPLGQRMPGGWGIPVVQHRQGGWLRLADLLLPGGQRRLLGQRMPGGWLKRLGQKSAVSAYAGFPVSSFLLSSSHHLPSPACIAVTCPFASALQQQTHGFQMVTENDLLQRISAALLAADCIHPADRHFMHGLHL